MKLKINKKPSIEESDSGEVSPLKRILKKTEDIAPRVGGDKGSGGIARAGIITGASAIQAAKEQAEAESSRRRAPEVFLTSKHPKTVVRFIGKQPIAAFWAVVGRLAGKFETFIVDPENEILTSALGTRVGKKQLRLVWPVYDVNGYQDKQGTQHVWVRRFLVTGQKLSRQIEEVRDQLAEDGSSILKRNLRISRTGADKTVTYTVMPLDPTPIPPAAAASEPIDPSEFYAPLTLDEQHAIVRRFATTAGSANYDPAE